MVEQVAERWSVWCEHADGRRYRMGDASETRWTQATAEGVAKHMTAHEVGTFMAQPCPSPTDFERVNARLIGLHGRAASKLWAAFVAYQEWQEDQGDADTFASWAREEIPDMMPVGGG